MTDFDLDLDTESIEVGLATLEEKGESDAVYLTGTNVEYAIFLERGTRKMPAYPWFAPAIREFQANPERFITANTDYASIEEIPTTTKVVEAVAVALQAKMEDNVNAQDPGRNRSPGTHPDHPSRDTGNLTGSIRAERIR